MFKQYWKEIICLLVVKAILLTGLWYVSFSNPPKLDDQAAGQHILGQQHISHLVKFKLRFDNLGLIPEFVNQVKLLHIF